VNHPEITIVIARATNGVIGAAGRLPWRLPNDLRRFKQLTIGSPMIMGRKTFDSLPGLLPDRRHVVLTRDENWSEEGAEAVYSVEEALRTANAPRVSVIGGAEIFRLFLAYADRIELTEVKSAPAGDALIDYPDPAHWRETARIENPSVDGRPAHDFISLNRIR
jgi:dihydrofolate reductase